MSCKLLQHVKRFISLDTHHCRELPKRKLLLHESCSLNCFRFPETRASQFAAAAVKNTARITRLPWKSTCATNWRVSVANSRIPLTNSSGFVKKSRVSVTTPRVFVKNSRISVTNSRGFVKISRDSVTKLRIPVTNSRISITNSRVSVTN